MTKKAEVEQVNQMFGPMRDLTALAVANAEKVVNFQLDALKRYTELGMAQLKSAVELKDADELQAYQAKSAQLAKTVTDSVRADAEAATQLGTAYVTDMQKLVQANLERISAKAA